MAEQPGRILENRVQSLTHGSPDCITDEIRLGEHITDGQQNSGRNTHYPVNGCHVKSPFGSHSGVDRGVASKVDSKKASFGGQWYKGHKLLSTIVPPIHQAFSGGVREKDLSPNTRNLSCDGTNESPPHCIVCPVRARHVAPWGHLFAPSVALQPLHPARNPRERFEPPWSLSNEY